MDAIAVGIEVAGGGSVHGPASCRHRRAWSDSGGASRTWETTRRDTRVDFDKYLISFRFRNRVSVKLTRATRRLAEAVRPPFAPPGPIRWGSGGAPPGPVGRRPWRRPRGASRRGIAPASRRMRASGMTWAVAVRSATGRIGQAGPSSRITNATRSGRIVQPGLNLVHATRAIRTSGEMEADQDRARDNGWRSSIRCRPCDGP